MAIPIDILINKDSNVYELTSASIKEAAFITKYGDTEIEKHNGKVVSTAITQVLENRVKYFFNKKES